MFIDNLALTEALLLFAAAVLTYVGVTTWWAIHKNRPESVRSHLKGAAMPLAAVGVASVVLGLWSEMAWPYPVTPVSAGHIDMAHYNILFNDITLVFGMVMIAFAASAYFGLRLQYVGIFAFIAGAVTILYGWTGYVDGYTSEPFEFFLLYAGFGMSGVLALPATVVTDYYLGTVTSDPKAWRAVPSTVPRRARFGTRAAQGLGVAARSSVGSDGTEGAVPLRYRVPFGLHLVMLAFPVFMFLAGFAAWWFLGTTVPGHLNPAKAAP